jgi:hypothetical protein
MLKRDTIAHNFSNQLLNLYLESRATPGISASMLIYLKARNKRIFRVYSSSWKNTIKVGILERLPRDIDWIQLAKFILDTSKLKFHSEKMYQCTSRYKITWNKLSNVNEERSKGVDGLMIMYSARSPMFILCTSCKECISRVKYGERYN